MTLKTTRRTLLLAGTAASATIAMPWIAKGAAEFQLFPNNQLGSDTDMLSQLRSGAIDLFTLSGLILSTLVPVASINGLGFIWENYGKVWPAMDGELGGYIRKQIEKSGLYAFEKQYDN